MHHDLRPQSHDPRAFRHARHHGAETLVVGTAVATALGILAACGIAAVMLVVSPRWETNGPVATLGERLVGFVYFGVLGGFGGGIFGFPVAAIAAAYVAHAERAPDAVERVRAARGLRAVVLAGTAVWVGLFALAGLVWGGLEFAFAALLLVAGVAGAELMGRWYRWVTRNDDTPPLVH